MDVQVARPSSTSFLIEDLLGLPSSRVVDLRIDAKKEAPDTGRTSAAKTKSKKQNQLASYRQFDSIKLGDEAVSPNGQEAEANQKRRSRTMFSEWQLASLEWRFARNKYLTSADRHRIAKLLQLNQMQVKTWFQVSA